MLMDITAMRPIDIAIIVPERTFSVLARAALSER